MAQTSSSPASVDIDPPLVASEIEFLAGFSSRGDIRRVWPGQPNPWCPWHPSADGRALELDAEVAAGDVEAVAPWLRFLCQEFLAPSTVDALHVALAHRLRGGHQVSGTVVVGGGTEVVATCNRITERTAVPEQEAVVLPFEQHRRGGAGVAAAPQASAAP